MHLYSGLVHSVIDQERRDLGTLVSLELNDLAHLLVIDDSTVAGEFLDRL